MSRTRIILASLLATFAVSAVASASAAAAPHYYTCTKETAENAAFYSTLALCQAGGVANKGFWKREKLPEGTVLHVTSEGTEKFVLKVTLLGVPVRIECNEKDKGTITNPVGGGAGTDTDTIEFTGCTVTEPAGCTVKQPIIAEAESLLVEVGGKIEDEFKPTGGGNFTTLTLENCGALNGPYPVKGTDNGIAVNSKSELEFTNASGALTVGGQAATLKGKSTIVMEGGTADISVANP